MDLQNLHIKPFKFSVQVLKYWGIHLTTSINLGKEVKCQDICDLMLRTYVKLELANPLTKHTLLVIVQIQDVFNASRNKVSRSSVKLMQVYPRNK